MRTIARFTVILFALVLAAAPTLLAAPIPAREVVFLAPASPHSTTGELVKLLLYGAAVFGAIRMRDTALLAGKYVTRASAAQGDYKSGVESAGADWEANAKAGEPNYEAGVQEAIGKKRYGRGISAAGSGKYVANASNLGTQRYVPGVQNAKEAWVRGFGPVADKIKSLNLPPKGPRRSPQNQQRANMVALELGKLKDAS